VSVESVVYVCMFVIYIHVCIYACATAFVFHGNSVLALVLCCVCVCVCVCARLHHMIFDMGGKMWKRDFMRAEERERDSMRSRMCGDVLKASRYRPCCCLQHILGSDLIFVSIEGGE